MQRTYGYRAPYLLAKDAGRIEGVLPLFHVKSRILGDYVTSLYRGLCTQNSSAARMLIERAKEITIASDARYLVLRDSEEEWAGELVSVYDHCTMIRDLPSQTDALWKSLDGRLRRHIRIALKSDLEVCTGGEEQLEDFYTVLSTFLRDKGTPAFSLAFLRNIAEVLGDLLLISRVRWQGQSIAAAASFLFRDTIFGAWGGALYPYMQRRPNHMIYWHYMRYGCEHGFRHIDLGRSQRGSGQYEFKKGWGAKPRPLYQQYFLNRLEAVSDMSAQAEGGYKYRLFTQLWRRLPLPLARWLGPQIRRHLPIT